jgi:hypothetical protein
VEGSDEAEGEVEGAKRLPEEGCCRCGCLSAVRLMTKAYPRVSVSKGRGWVENQRLSAGRIRNLDNFSTFVRG